MQKGSHMKPRPGSFVRLCTFPTYQCAAAASKQGAQTQQQQQRRELRRRYNRCAEAAFGSIEAAKATVGYEPARLDAIVEVRQRVSVQGRLVQGKRRWVCGGREQGCAIKPAM